MKIDTRLVDLILTRRSAFLGQILKDSDCLDMRRRRSSLPVLLNEIDRIFYTLDFLKKAELVKIGEKGTHETIEIFDGYSLFDSEDGEKTVYGLLYYRGILGEPKYALSWQVEMLPGLLAFKNNGYKTDEQRKEFKNFWLAIGVAILASALTALFN